MTASASGLFYEASINKALVNLALRVHSESPCVDQLQRLECETKEWIAIIIERRIMADVDHAGLLDEALITLRETREKLFQALDGALQ